jgi:hypothetical protein
MLCAAAIDGVNARSNCNTQPRWKRAGHTQGYALTGDLAFARLKSPLPTNRPPVGSAGRTQMDVTQRSDEFPQPDCIKCAKVKVSEPTT